jgi:hypothetical protein
LFYEKQVGSFSRLMREIRQLDSDAGIRLSGTFNGRTCLVFLTRSVGGFAVIVCAASKNAHPVPGRKLLAKQFARTGELKAFLTNVTKGQVQAFVY